MQGDLEGLKLTLFFAKAQQTEASRNAHQASQVPSVAELKYPTPPRIHEELRRG